MNVTEVVSKLKQYPIPVVGCVVILLAAGVLFMRKPKVDDLAYQVEEKVDVLEKVQRNTERAIGLEEDVEIIEAYRDEINDRLMVEEEVATNYAYFYNLERQTGIRIVNINQKASLDKASKPPQIPATNSYSVIPYTLAIQGSFAQVLDFVHRLERGKYLLRIDKFNTTTQTTEAASVIVASMDIFILGEK